MSDMNALGRLAIEQVPVADIRTNAYNPNRQSDHEFQLLVKSMQMDGITQPVIVNRLSMEIVDGEHRWRAAQACGYTHVPVVFVNMTPEQMRISTLRHNRARGSEDVELAADILKEFAALGVLDMATDELMLDPVEIQRLVKEIGVSEATAIAMDVDPSQLGPNGRGLTAGDTVSGVDTSADHTRAKEKAVAGVKRDEEHAMTAEDASTYRLVCLFSAQEADTVRGVLGDTPAKTIVDLCREFAS